MSLGEVTFVTLVLNVDGTWDIDVYNNTSQPSFYTSCSFQKDFENFSLYWQKGKMLSYSQYRSRRDTDIERYEMFK